MKRMMSVQYDQEGVHDPEVARETMKPETIMIRIFDVSDWGALWAILAPVFRAGETYAFSPEITEDEAYRVWVEMPAQTYVAVDGADHVLGTYYIKANQPALGAHVCNCGYIVAEFAGGRGIASGMCEHSQRTAIALGFKSMQYNLVVSTNEAAIHLWQKHGFEIVGTLPEAFRHPRFGLVNAHVMYKKLKMSNACALI
ncbi:GNAT family protein [Pontiellaceae bacterium B1224]|nr:GNAT family protein [Pontiellaceae bacterium B1224]